MRKRTYLSIVISYLLFLATTTAIAAEMESHVGKWIPDLHQCKVIEVVGLTEGGGDLYIFAECDVSSRRNATLRLWRTRAIPNSVGRLIDTTIVGEAILRWRRVVSYGSTYSLIHCREKSSDAYRAIGLVDAVGLSYVEANRATVKYGLLYFKESASGGIEVISVSEIAECLTPMD